MRYLKALCLIVCVMVMAGCYAATIETGRPAGTKVVEKKWASSWIYGLVPPSTITTTAACPNGVAKVQTQLSFLNQLVGILTWGIYTPMQIVVTCAEESHADRITSGAEMQVAYNASAVEVQEVFTKAAKAAVETGHPVYVRMTFE